MRDARIKSSIYGSLKFEPYRLVRGTLRRLGATIKPVRPDRKEGGTFRGSVSILRVVGVRA
jgi:hypothetical protein